MCVYSICYFSASHSEGGMFLIRMVRMLFGLKWDELHDLCSSQDIMQLIKERRMRWAEHVARIVDRTGITQGFGEETGRKEAS